ncbi:MAG: hypothetical protein LAP38_12775 [Acidobacteriia bacterium]|nr:hypothetical protein [Terriglobia bacterium]
MKIFNAVLKVAALLIAVGYLIVWSEKGRYTLGRWGPEFVAPLILDTHTGKLHTVSGRSVPGDDTRFATFDMVAGTATSKKAQ